MLMFILALLPSFTSSSNSSASSSSNSSSNSSASSNSSSNSSASSSSNLTLLHTDTLNEQSDRFYRATNYLGLDVVHIDPSNLTSYLSTSNSSVVLYISSHSTIPLCRHNELMNKFTRYQVEVVTADKKDEEPTFVMGSPQNLLKFFSGEINSTRDENEDLVHTMTQDLEVGFMSNNRILHYVKQNKPCFLRARKPEYAALNRFGNYIPAVNMVATWPGSTYLGYCKVCRKMPVSFEVIKSTDKVVIAGYILQWTPLVTNWLNRLLGQDLPKGTELFFLIYCNVTEHMRAVEFATKKQGGDGLVLGPDFFKGKELADIRTHGTQMCLSVDCDWYFAADSEVILLRSNIISHLTKYNFSVVAPLITDIDSGRSNFWGAVSSTGFYSRSPDFYDIVDGMQGIFIMPYISSIIFARSSTLPNYTHPAHTDSDIALAANYREKSVFMWLDSTLKCGTYANTTRTQFPLPNQDLYSVLNNYHGWVDFAINKDIAFKHYEKRDIAGNCANSILLPIFTADFCETFIAALKTYVWPSGKGNEVKMVSLRDLRYKGIMDSVIHDSVKPYVKKWFNVEGVYTADKGHLFIQDKSTVEVQSLEEGYDLVLLLTDNEEQGVQFQQEGCYQPLPPGTFLISPGHFLAPFSLQSTNNEVIGIYIKLIGEEFAFDAYG